MNSSLTPIPEDDPQDGGAAPIPHPLASAFEDAMIGMTLLAPDNRRLRVNRAFCEFLGYSRRELLDRTLLDIVHPADVDEDRRQRALLLAGEKASYRREKRYLHKQGHVLWADFSCRLVRDPHGRPLHFIGQVQDITQRKQAEQALQESEARFRSLCEMSTDWYWEQDAQFRFTRFHDNARTPPWMVERRQELIGKRRWEIPGVTPVHGHWSEHEATLQAHLPFRDFEYYESVNHRWTMVSGDPVYDAAGRFTGYRGTGRDITDARRTEHRLRDAQLLVGMAVQIGRVGAWAWNEGDKLLTASAELRAILGLPPDFAPTPKDALAAFSPEHRPRIRATLQRCMEQGSPFDAEAEAVTPDGRRVWVRVICEPEWDARGRVCRLHGAVQDITDMRQAQHELRESQRMLAGLLANLPGMVYRCLNDRDWPIDFASQGALQLTGYTPQQLADGDPVYASLIHPDDREPVWNEVQQALAEHRQYQLTYRIATAAGEEKWVWEQGAGVYEPDGALRCLEGLITDVTDTHRAQMEVSQVNEHLEVRVRQRTEELQQANAELEAFAYSIAHDLRAPMTALDGFSRLLERNLSGLDERNAHFFRRIQGNVRHMSELTDALLALARLSAVELSRHPVDLAEIAGQLLDQLKELEPDRVLRLDLPARMPATGDRRLLQQVMANLIGNAWKFSRTQPETVIRLAMQRDENGAAVYSVSDKGVGFDMAHAKNLFSAFHRMHSAGEFEGTGIGLALVRKIVQRHGGRIWAQSRPGEGTTVFFTLAP